MSRIVITAASRVGCVRNNNEDMVFAYDKFVRSEAYQTEFMTENVDRFVIALADGMGGHLAGEVASADTLENLRFFVSDMPKGLSVSEVNKTMEVWLDSIHKIITSKGHADPSMEGMGTTLVAVIYYEGKYFWINCGDSRLYRLRDGKLAQLTTDHSLNTLRGEKRHSNIITNCIGAGCKHTYMDMVEFTDDFRHGDVYMVCSDGLSDMVSDDVIEQMMINGVSANRLCEAAIEKGGFDNVSVCVFSVM
ncbi:PP2C family serine/threonine-protein phosphatase [Prevotella sp. tf2-5]|jgi:protein phosphatase|uniref:PP2C family protein-serine/threonine phosphatase n=1 Tax=Prevotella sp. tf2-5 TaxID=1761889 RepID=UPI0008E16540|nr:protein phosphatase 2C domain-containing protein [Prevotella sp. tf2-5]SFO54701.1 protein phosphatase [Prevotella sp. tf2-5]